MEEMEATTAMITTGTSIATMDRQRHEFPSNIMLSRLARYSLAAAWNVTTIAQGRTKPYQLDAGTMSSVLNRRRIVWPANNTQPSQKT
jgi:hypothetical protein